MFLCNRQILLGLPVLSNGDPRGIPERSLDHHFRLQLIVPQEPHDLGTRASDSGTTSIWLAQFWELNP